MFFCLILCTALALAQDIPAPANGAFKSYCFTSNNCASDECCRSIMQPNGKRSIQPVFPFNFNDQLGNCQKRRNKTDTCFIPGLKPVTEGLYYNCPCNDGLDCKGTGRHAGDFGELGVCSETVSSRCTTGQPCHRGSDCAANECCVSDNRPIGKRQLRVGGASAHCKPMRTSGSGCLVRYPPGKPVEMVFQCPCTSGLTCHGNGHFDIPLGEMGTCGV